MNEDVTLTPDLVKKLLDEGHSITAIGAMTGKSKQYVSRIARRYNLRKKTPREIALEHYPWKTGKKFHDAYENRAMRDHAEYVATGGKGMAEWKRERLRDFYRRIIEEGLVIEFDPNLPPGASADTLSGGRRRGGGLRRERVGGFAWRKRRESDGDLIIRVNDYTTLTEEGRMLWRLPDVLP